MVLYIAKGLADRAQARDLLAWAVKEAWGLSPLPEIASQAGGKPFFPGYPNRHFNLSHSGDLALCALDAAPVGADIQIVKEWRPSLPAYFCISIFALFMYSIWQFWILAAAVGVFQGGIQALSRSYFARIIPKNQTGEYFGLYDIAGKGASFLGTLVVGLITQLTGQQNIAVGTLAFLFLIGYLIFARANTLPDPVYDENGAHTSN